MGYIPCSRHVNTKKNILEITKKHIIMEKQKDKKGKITIANYIAMTGLALLLVFTFIGHSFKSGGEMGLDILTAVGVTALAALFLVLLIKAKEAENRLEMWRKVEVALVAGYVLVVVPLSFVGGIPQFFNVLSQKEYLKKVAQEDIATIDSMFAHYESFENAALTETRNGLSNAGRDRFYCDDAVKDFFNYNNIEFNNEASVDNFIEMQRRALLGNTYKKYKEHYAQKRKEMAGAIDGWSMMKLATTAKMLDKAGEVAAKTLGDLSHEAKLPLIVNYNMTQDNQALTFSEGEYLKFRKALMDAHGFSTGALLFILLLHLLIIFNYIVAYRTHTLSPRKKPIDDGGTILG